MIAMKTILLTALATLTLSACTATRAGVSQDANDFGDRVQRTSEIWTQ